MWIELFVRPRDESLRTDEYIRQCDDRLMVRTDAAFVSRDDQLVMAPGSTWIVHVPNEKELWLVTTLLTEEYGFEIVKQEEHENRKE